MSVEEAGLRGLILSEQGRRKFNEKVAPEDRRANTLARKTELDARTVRNILTDSGADSASLDVFFDRLGIPSNTKDYCKKSTVQNEAQTVTDANAKDLPHKVNVPGTLSENFVGRGEFIEDVHAQLMSGSDVAVTQVISGLGGIGKTQTALKYIEQHGDKYSCVLWASADSLANLNTDCEKIARQVIPGLPADAKQDDVLRVFHQWLESPDNANYLLVLDNADFDAKWTQAQCKAALPAHRTGKLLLTSRNRDFPAFGGVQVRRLDVLSETEALALFAKLTPITLEGDELTAAKSLAHTLEYLPLAVEQIAAFIRITPGMNFARYAKRFAQRELNALPEDSPRSADYPKSLQTVWNISLEALRPEHSESILALQAFAFLDPEAIPTRLLMYHATVPESPLHAVFADCEDEEEYGEQVERLLLPLLNYSLITAIEELKIIGLHRMVQAAMRHPMKHEQRQAWIDWTTTTLNHVFPDPREIANWETCKAWIPTILAFAAHMEREKVTTANAARLLNETAFFLNSQARYADALPLYERALAIREAALGPMHPDTATSLNNLASLYESLSRYDDALPLFVRALEIREAALGPMHPDTATSLNNLAGLYERLSRYDAALPLYVRALEISEAALGPMHPDTAGSLNNLASLYRQIGRYNDALPLYERATAIVFQVFGEAHPTTQTIWNNLIGCAAEIAAADAPIPENPSRAWQLVAQIRANPEMLNAEE